MGVHTRWAIAFIQFACLGDQIDATGCVSKWHILVGYLSLSCYFVNLYKCITWWLLGLVWAVTLQSKDVLWFEKWSLGHKSLLLQKRPYVFAEQSNFRPLQTMSGEIFGHNRPESQCFQVQPVTCSDLAVFFFECKIHFTYSSIMMGNFPEVLNFNRFIRVILLTQKSLVRCYW